MHAIAKQISSKKLKKAATATTMTGKGFDVDSDILHLKKYSRSRRCDRISELPDEIITHILSFLSLKEAVATSILSSRWSNSWKHTPNLVFVNNSDSDPIINIPKAKPNGEPKDSCLEHSLMNVEWVNSILNSYKSLSLKQFTLSFYLHRDSFHHVSKWLHFAFSRQVESLKLDFESSYFALDLNVLSGVQSSDCRFLKVLTLQNLRVHGEAIEFLLNNCPVLEGLMIINATFWSNVVIGGSSLKYLEISIHKNLGRFIKVCAPNLTRLLIFDHKHKRLLLGNMPNLVEASFPLYEDETMLHFPKAAAQLEDLTVSLHRPKAFTVPRMPKLKKLVVDYALVSKEYMLPITCLLEASPCLEEFKLEISHTDYYSDSSIRKAIFEVPEDGGYRHKHLKVFEFVGFCDKAADQVKLVRYIGNCIGLEEIVITPISTRVAREFQLRRDGWERMRNDILRRRVVKMIAEEREALEIKKSMEDVLAGKLSDGIKLRVK